jgi:hypothetical protein
MIGSKSNGNDTGVSAHTTGVSSCKSNESTLSPAGSPRVLDLPSSTSINSDQKDRVVDGWSTVSEHSRFVRRPVSGVNGHGNWWRVNSAAESSTSSETFLASDLDVTSFCLASLVSGYIRIFSSCSPSVFSGIRKGAVRPSSVAALVSFRSGAINKLLLWEADGLSLEEEERFSDTGSRESPAWSTAALVLDRGDFSLGGPVNSANNFIFVVSLRESNQWHGGLESSGKFFSSVNSELVNAHFVGLGVVGIVLVDENEVLLEDKSSVCFLLRGPVDTVLSLPLIKGGELCIAGCVINCQDG